MSREEHKGAIEVSVIFHEGQRMFAVPKQPAQPLKTVIEMALEAGFGEDTAVIFTYDRDGDCTEELEAFATLVRADERSSWPAEMEAMERQVNILTDALAEAKADAWEEGYKQGVDDERTSEASIGIAGGNFKVNPARENPYRARGSKP